MVTVFSDMQIPTSSTEKLLACDTGFWTHNPGIYITDSLFISWNCTMDM